MKRLAAQTEEVMMSLGNQRTNGRACLKKIGCERSGLTVGAWKALLNTVMDLGFYFR
jgi:hypothetical protein